MSPRDVLKLCQQKDVRFVDLRFMDFPGLWQHTTCPISELTAESFGHGFGFDGSSIRGWQAINESDMLLLPDASTVVLDPFMAQPTLSLICHIVDPITRENRQTSTGEGIPIIHVEFSKDIEHLDLLMMPKGS